MRTGIWSNVETNCQVRVSAAPLKGSIPQFVGGARFVPDQGDIEMWRIIASPHTHTIAANSGNATARIGIRFLTSTTTKARVTISVVKPDGTPLPENSGNQQFEVVLEGKQGDGIQRCTAVFLKKRQN